MEAPILAVFDEGPAGWVGVSALRAGDVDYLNNQARHGERMYVRGQVSNARPVHPSRPVHATRVTGTSLHDRHGLTPLRTA